MALPVGKAVQHQVAGRFGPVCAAGARRWRRTEAKQWHSDWLIRMFFWYQAAHKKLLRTTILRNIRIMILTLRNHLTGDHWASCFGRTKTEGTTNHRWTALIMQSLVGPRALVFMWVLPPNARRIQLQLGPAQPCLNMHKQPRCAQLACPIHWTL